MSDHPTGADQTVALLKIQGLLAAAYDVSRGTDNRFLSYLIKMARMEAKARIKARGDTVNETGDPDDLDRL